MASFLNNAFSDKSKDESNSLTTFLASLVFNIGVALVIFFAFCILRPRFRRVYAPRTYAVEREKRSQKIGDGIFAWIPAILRIPDEDIIRRSGLDTYMFLRSIRTMFIMFSVIAVVTCGALLPINILGTGGRRGLLQLSISNLSTDSYLIWVHIGIFALLVCWVMWSIVGELRLYTQLRMWWLTNPENSSRANANMVLVTGVPEKLVKDEGRLADIFDVLPGGVRQVIVSRESKELAAAVKKRDGLAARLEKMLTAYALKCTKLSDRAAAKGTHYVAPGHPRLRAGVWGKRVDAFEYLASEIAMCNHFIAQCAKTRHEFKPQSAALVLFNQQIAAHLAAQAVVDYKPLSMGRVSTNVDPQDVIWTSLDMNPWSRRIRGYLSFVAYVGLTIVWTLATAFLMGLVQVKNLAILDRFSWLRGNDVAIGLFSGIVPSALLALLMSVLPHLLRLLLRLEGTPTRSEINLRLLHRLFFFQVWNVYLVTIFSSSIVAITANAVGNPKEIVGLVQTQVPLSATNVLTYVLLLAFIGAAKEILQGVPLALRYLVPILFARTPRALFRAEMPSRFDWATNIPTHSLIFLMGFSYSFIAPIVNIFVAVYFGLFYLIYRYQFLYVYNDQRWSLGGLSFPKAVKQMLVAVYISEVYLLLMMVAKFEVSANAIMRIVVVLGVMAGTLGAHLYIDDVYMPAIKYLPLKKAADVERAPHLSGEIPDVVGKRLGSSDNLQELLLAEQRQRRRNWIFIMYGSVVPAFLLRLAVWTFPSVVRAKVSLDEAPHMPRQPTESGNRLGMRDSRLTLGEDAAELERSFACPAIRAKPVCNLWVPLGNSVLFARLLWEVEYYGQGTILVITQGAEISPRGKVCADMDFSITGAEAMDKDGVAYAQRTRPM
ncbi:phosphate metabolism protein 7 [Coemansia spiralis]|uniref:Phosphate metabolism protein 7 n=1 Tax=Coemansia spiralis TaxID=417178 RepID=A0A9W8L4I6_9FUNG|nr:phosphate metabolism protein 7 [Coemansia spiralis]